MGLIQNLEEYSWKVAVKKGVAAALGFLASQQAITGMAWLEAHGISIKVDTAKFQETITVVGIAGFALCHDWLRLRFPESKWL